MSEATTFGATEAEKRITLDRGHVIEYVGGPRPYLWIGSPEGTYYDSISVRDIQAFLDAVSS